MPAHHGNKGTQRDGVFYQRLGVEPVLNSNVTSSHFLGSAPRSWMVGDTENGSMQARPRRISNSAPQRPELQRAMAALPAQPLIEDSTVEVVRRLDISPVAGNPTSESILASTRPDLRTQVQHDGTTEASSNVSRAGHRASVSNATSASMVLDTPADSPGNAPVAELDRLPAVTPATPTQAGSTAISNGNTREIAADKESPVTTHGRLVQAANGINLDALESASGVNEAARSAEVSTAPSTTIQQGNSVQPTAKNVGRDEAEELLADESALVENDPQNPSLLCPSISTAVLDVQSFIASPELIILEHLVDQQNIPRQDNATSIDGRTTFQPGDDCPRGASSIPTVSRKRSADVSLSGLRTSRARTSTDSADLPRQLPTPQASPNITNNTTTLSGQFESALAAVLRHPMTVDVDSAFDSARIEWLREACRRNDRFYLLTHAVLCLFSAGEVTTLALLQIVDMHIQGLKVLVTILGSNRRVGKELFRLFINFPQPPEIMVLDNSHEFKMLLEEVRCFLYHLASGFAKMRDAAIKRGCPPCPAEFKFVLKLPSPVLQKALFMSILRQSCNDDAFLSTALSLFEQEMSNAAGSAISMSALNAYHGTQLPSIVNQWAIVYGTNLKPREEMSMAREMQLPRPQQLPDTGPGSGRAQMPESPIVPSNRPGWQSTQSASPTIIQHHSQMPHYSPSSHPQYHFHPQIPNSVVHAAGANIYPVSPAIHQPLNHNLHPQIQHAPYWRNLSNHAPNLPISAVFPIQPVQQSQSSNATQMPPFKSMGPAALSVSNSSMGRASMSLDSSVLPLPPGQSGNSWKEVDGLIARRVRDGRTEYHVRWRGESAAEDAWLPKNLLRDSGGTMVGWRSKKTGLDQRDPLRVGYNATEASRSMEQIRRLGLDPNSLPSAIIHQQHSLDQHLIPNGVRLESAAVQQGIQANGSPHTPVRAALRQPPAPARSSTNTSSVTASTDDRRISSSLFVRNTNPVVQRVTTTPGFPQGSTLTPDQIQQRASPGPGLHFFHPDPNFNLPQAAIPEPQRIALHQAGLASPVYHKMTEFDGNEVGTRYYQFIDDIIQLPQLLTKDSDLIRWKVRIPSEIWARRTMTLPAVGEFSFKERNVSNGDSQFRLKSILFDPQEGQTQPTLSEFCSQPVRWPKCLSVTINGVEGVVDFRRKPHWGVDLSTDITELLEEGENEVVIGAIFSAQETAYRFLMAIEILCVADHSSVLRMPTRIPAAESLAAITNALKKQSNADDDLIIEQREMSIDLVDPFMSIIWEIPVRGKACVHRECFDLSAFLLSRTSRVAESGLNSPDKWHCPICKSDCRPPMLVVDVFLVDVRSTLVQNDQLHAKAIIVQADGSWEPRLELPSKDADQDTPDPDVPITGTLFQITSSVTQPKSEAAAVPPPAQAASASNTPRLPIDQREIIILDDDD